MLLHALFLCPSVEFFFSFSVYLSGVRQSFKLVRTLFANHLPLSGRMKHCVLIFVVTSLLSSIAAPAQSVSETHSEQYLKNLFSSTVLFDTTTFKKAEPVLEADSHDEWKQWRTVDNYFYGKNRGSLPMIADLDALHPYVRDKVIALIEKCKSMGIILAIVESYRTHSKQAEYYAMGRKYTSTPGGKSRHQYGLAVDVVPIVDSVAVWNNHKLWRKIGSVGERLGLTWGGRWRVLYDPGHFEWSGGVSRHQLAKGHLPRIPSAMLERYASCETQLEKLQSYWDAWEVEQSAMANISMKKKTDENEEMVGAGN